MAAPALSGQVLSRAVRVRAYAKLNLHLEVLGRRPDGYHEVRTLMQSVDLADRLILRAAPGSSGIHLRISGPAPGAASLDPGPSNLVVRALEALRARYRVRSGAEVRLWKRIPSGAGLGGGSSDAAAALVAGARIWRLSPRPGALCSLAAALGADVPFFLHGGAAWMGGRGERELRRGRLPAFVAVVAYPNLVTSTEAAYRGLKIPLTTKWRPSSISDYSFGPSTALEFVLDGSNAFTTSLLRRHPGLKCLESLLLAEGARGVRPTGSGSALFGIVPSARAARSIASRIRRAGYPAWTVQPVERGMHLLP